MTDSDTQTPPSESVGQKLKALRESRNIGALEVASQLHLDSRIINAIEDDDYNALPAAIYIRGYIRSYSKLVGGDADALVRLFENSVGVQEPEIIPEIKYPPQTSSSDKPVKAFTYLIILGLVVLVIAWWQSNYIIELQPPTDTSDPLPDTAVPTGIVLEEISTPETPYTLAVPLQIPVELLDIDQFAPAAGSTDGDIVSDDSIVPAELADLTPTILDEPIGPVTSLADTDTSASVNTVSVPAALPPTEGPDSLILNLTADSWIEITDINNQKLFMDLARTGTTLNLRGTAPFEILLGFAQGVTLEYNGSPFDIAPYSRAGVAKFSLGE